MTNPQEGATPARPPPPVRRRAWLAALLSFFSPGVGQLYNGERRRAMILFAIFAVLDLAFFFVVPIFDPDLPVLAAFAALTIGFLGLQIGAAVHAFIRARRAAPAPLGPWQRGWVYAAMVVAPLALNFAAPRWIKGYDVPSASNVPTLLVGDRLFAEIGYYRHHAPQRGEMIIFKSPKDGRTVYVKRIVGLPGEKLQLRDGILYIDGQAVPRRRIDDYSSQFGGSAVVMHQYVETLPGGASYQILQMSDDQPLENTAVYDVPAGHYFTLGDNRDNSMDSRLAEFGYVPAANLIARAYIIYWPLARLGLRFD
jgi:signal peptidase I